jgi:hypothetical protein
LVEKAIGILTVGDRLRIGFSYLERYLPKGDAAAMLTRALELIRSAHASPTG